MLAEVDDWSKVRQLWKASEGSPWSREGVQRPGSWCATPVGAKGGGDFSAVPENSSLGPFASMFCSCSGDSWNMLERPDCSLAGSLLLRTNDSSLSLGKRGIAQEAEAEAGKPRRVS